MSEHLIERLQQLQQLRVPFPPNQISYLPKGGVKLAYVGHAALTDRLLDVDPGWTWEPLSMADSGLPVMDDMGGMWIKLTVCGVTRLGYGHAGTKTGGDAIKEVIGDALRNAAMRFGAALDLWHKGDLHGDEEEKKPEPKRPDTAANAERASWLEQQRKRIFEAATVGEVRKALANAVAVAMPENDGSAVDQLNAWADEKMAQAKPKTVGAISLAPVEP